MINSGISAEELQQTAARLRLTHWELQKHAGIDFIPSNDFSFYDNVLDTAVLLNIIPKRYRELNLSPLDTFFAMARGYQGDHGDVQALAMKKWFNTNYHYIVPEIDADTVIKLNSEKPFAEYQEAAAAGIKTKPVVIGPFTLLKLARYTSSKQAAAFVPAAAEAYREILRRFANLGAEWVQLDEPSLVRDLSAEDIALFDSLYTNIMETKGQIKVLVQTYFGDVRDIYSQLTALPFDGIGLDFIEGRETLDLVQKFGFPGDKVLFAGLVNGKNIWRNHYARTLGVLDQLKNKAAQVVLSTSCSLLHVPYTLRHETKLDAKYTKYFAFAEEKLQELAELKHLADADDPNKVAAYRENLKLFDGSRDCTDPAVQARVKAISDSEYTRLPAFDEREKIQHAKFKLPLFPTTTIGSFPQTPAVRQNRAAFKQGKITLEQYKEFNRQEIAACIKHQEEIGLDVLVHGEFERNDMVEYFGEHLNGFLFTQKAWVQSYGTRCVKPPIIWGDVSRASPITVEWSVFAQKQTKLPMKGMLTGPVTIQNWSFPREDVSLKETALQLALALRDEVLDLEKNGIKIIQIDEAALREKLPLRRSDWDKEYLSWAIPSFRLVHSGVQADTQIHTHMCYSEFTDIIPAIDQMDADVITFEASRSDLLILDALKANHFKTEVGPGVYDIHSPRIPSTEEIVGALEKMVAKIPLQKLWVNPDCGLKTRGNHETWLSLEHLVAAAKQLRHEYSK